MDPYNPKLLLQHSPMELAPADQPRAPMELAPVKRLDDAPSTFDSTGRVPRDSDSALATSRARSPIAIERTRSTSSFPPLDTG
eukprot:7386984-Prymnesium_polylepis.1